MTGFDDLYKLWLGHELTLAKLQRFGKVWFVDRENGSDSNPGKKPTAALLTLEAADALCTDRAWDVIVFKGRTTTGQQFTTSQVLATRGVVLLGAGGIYGMGGGYENSCFVTPHTCDEEGTYGGPGGLMLDADDQVVMGMKFYNPDATKAQSHIVVEDSRDPGDGRGHAIISNVFQGQGAGTADRTNGVKVIGTETGLIKNNMFYYCETAIYLRGGSVRYANGNVVEDNIIRGSKYGIQLDTTVQENFIRRNSIAPKLSWGYAMTYGFTLDDLAAGNFFEDNKVFHATKGTAYDKGAGANHWINNYYSLSGGTLYDGS